MPVDHLTGAGNWTAPFTGTATVIVWGSGGANDGGGGECRFQLSYPIAINQIVPFSCDFTGNQMESAWGSGAINAVSGKNAGGLGGAGGNGGDGGNAGANGVFNNFGGGAGGYAGAGSGTAGGNGGAFGADGQGGDGADDSLGTMATPPGGGGPNGEGGANGQVNVFYTYPAPAPAACNPPTGSTAGGTHVTITGTGFSRGCTVTFGGFSAASVVAVNDSTITCVTPAHAAGAVNVAVVTADGISSGTLANGYAYATPTAPPTKGIVVGAPPRNPITKGILRE